MKIFPEIVIPNAICKFDNYTQSFEWLQLLIWIFAILGFCWLVLTIINFFRTGK